MKSQTHRERYTWHLRPPFNVQFDRVHWWQGKTELDQAAALYELARRHPSVGQRRAEKAPAKNAPPSFHWTCLLGLNSWEKLDYRDRENWKASVGKLKGLDFRDEGEQCRSLRVLANWKIIDQRKELLKKDGATFTETSLLARQDLAKNPPTDKEWEQAISQRAIEAHREGYILLAVVPDLSEKIAAKILVKKYEEHRSFYLVSEPKQRARWEEWLPLISEFENAATSKSGVKSQLFARYRRMADSIRFQ